MPRKVWLPAGLALALVMAASGQQAPQEAHTGAQAGAQPGTQAGTAAVAGQQPAPATAANAAPQSEPGAAQETPARTEKPGRKPTKHEKVEAQKLFLQGARELEHKNLRAAMEAFTRAAELDPGEQKYALSDQIARQHLVTELIEQSDKDKILGHTAEARAEIAQAYSVDPASPVVAQHMQELASTVVAGEPAIRTEADALAPPIQLEPKPGLQSFHLRGTERNIIAQVLPAYGIQPTVDDSVGAQTIRYDVDDADFATALRALELTTGTFMVPLDPARALIARESRNNRDKFEREAAETVYLPGMEPSELTEIANMARNVFALRTATTVAGQSALMVRGPGPSLDALNATLGALMDGRSELQLDVRMYEIDRTKAVNLGVILPNQTTLFNVYSEARNLLNSNSSLVQEIISGGLAAPGDWEAILAILIASGQISNSILTQPFGVFGGGLSMTGVVYQGGSLNMQLNSSDVRALDQLQTRVLDREDATIKVGERYPIETSSYSSLSGSSLSIPGISNAGLSSTLQNLGVSLSQLQSAASLTIPQVQYQDIGLTLKVTPTMEGGGRVSLKFDLTLSSLGGSSLNGLPVLNNREYQAVTSMKTEESAVVVSSLTRQESDAITGVPGLSELPGFQSTTNKNSNVDIGELAIVVTPHIVRRIRHGATEKMILLPGGPPPGP